MYTYLKSSIIEHFLVIDNNIDIVFISAKKKTKSLVRCSCQSCVKFWYLIFALKPSKFFSTLNGFQTNYVIM